MNGGVSWWEALAIPVGVLVIFAVLRKIAVWIMMINPTAIEQKRQEKALEAFKEEQRRANEQLREELFGDLNRFWQTFHSRQDEQGARIAVMSGTLESLVGKVEKVMDRDGR